MKIRSALIFLLSIAVTCHADFIYNADFENPPHVVGAPVVTGTGSNVPSGTTGSVIVRDSLGDFTTQVASLEPAGSMSFHQSAACTNGVVSIRWDMAVLSLGGTPGSSFVSVQSTGSGAAVLNFNQDLSIAANGDVIGTFILGKQDHFQYIFNLNSDLYSLSLNGNPVISNDPLAADFDISNVVFGRDSFTVPQYAVDNFQWEIIPEPSTWILLVMGGGILCGWWFKRSAGL